MFRQLNQVIDKTDNSDEFDYLNETLIEAIWRDLDGQISREKIREVAAEVAAEFQDAVVTLFVPIFIRRQTREKLKIMTDEKT